MTTLLLVRHAVTKAPPDVLLGRNDETGLNAAGSEQAAHLAQCLRRLPIAIVLSSPLLRATETAGVIARALGLSVQISCALNEIDYGEWTGRSFAELSADPRWLNFNTARCRTPIPGGETIQQVEDRVAAELRFWTEDYPADLVVAVTHAEIIRIAALQTLGLSSDHFDRIEISPASVTVLRWDSHRKRVICLNESGELGRPVLTAL